MLFCSSPVESDLKMALYSYVAQNDNELSFDEGNVIKQISEVCHSVSILHKSP